jgi:hypothetical protein
VPWSFDNMSYAVINIGDRVGKTVGRRVLKDAWKYGMGLQKLGNQLSETLGHGGLCCKGVYRFTSHEDADQWMTKMLVERANRAAN